MEIILKNNFIPLQKLELENLTLKVLAPKHNEIDFEAWNSSREELKDIFGPRNGWPGEVSSLEHNLKDLENHLREFNEKEAFTYTLLSKDERTCLGCLYIRPSKAKEFDCRVDFWFRNSHKELESDFYKWLQTWLLDEWSFDNVAFPGRSISWNEYYEVLGES